MVSRFAKSNKWYDVLFVLVLIIVLCAAIQIVAPGSGLAKSVHTGFHALAIGVNWLGNGLITLAGLLNQL